MAEGATILPISGLRWDGDAWEGQLDWPGRRMITTRFELEDDKSGLKNTHQLIDSLNWLRGFEPQIREYIAMHYFPGLYSEWNETPISREQFVSRLALEHVGLWKDWSWDLMYDDDDMFAGHGVEIYIEADRTLRTKPSLSG